MAGRTYASVLISWKSQKFTPVVKSALSAETFACVKALDSGILLQHILNEVTCVKLPTLCY